MTKRPWMTTCLCGAILIGVALGAAAQGPIGYKLLATSKTSTMQRELSDTGAQGFEFVGMTVASTAMGGNELVTITRRKVR